MTVCLSEFDTIKSVFHEAELWTETEQPLVYLPDLRVSSAGKQHTVNVLLCPRARDSYQTRLFFSERLPCNRNWSVFNIKGITWHAISWQGIPANDDWMEILASHIETVK